MTYEVSLNDRKKAIFDSMAVKRQKQILSKKTYDQWDPFEKPKDPIDIRTDKTGNTSFNILKCFLHDKVLMESSLSEAYHDGILKMIIGLINNDDYFLAMYEFSIWYEKFLNKNSGGS